MSAISGGAHPIGSATPGTKGIDVEWFSNNYKNTQAALMQVIFFHYGLAAGAAGLIQYTIDGGTTWHDARNGVETLGGSTDIKQVPLPVGGEFNMRSKAEIVLDFADIGVF